LRIKNEQANRQTDADRAETVQGNIEKARTNEIAARNAELEHRKIDLEHQKLTQGGYVDANEQRQANIEKARSNELAGQQFEHAKTQSQRDEERSKREHEVAMKPPTPAAAAARLGRQRMSRKQAPRWAAIWRSSAISEIPECRV